MKLFFYIAICVLSVGCAPAAQQQQTYKSHIVEKGETVSSIARTYNTTPQAIYQLNPDARSGLNVNSVIILPLSSVKLDSGNSHIRFKEHRVKRKETLFSISQEYNVSIDDLKKYNKELYSRGLKKGEKIQIPLPSRNVISSNESTTNETPVNTGATHKVEPKETKYGIARKYNITIAQLEEMNPGLTENLPIGTVLNVPEGSVTDTATIEDDKYDFYEVQKKEGFYRLKVKLGLSEEEIIALNPYAKEGLKDGMILKIPKENSAVFISEDVEKVDLERRIRNTKEKNLVLMLPFQLPRFQGDSIDSNSKILRDSKSTTSRVALDFYSGVLMATEFAKDKGISIHMDVYDTEGSESKVGSIIASKNFKNIDAVIGPLFQKTVEKAAAELRSTDTPVFSPLSNREVRMYSNLFQTIPTDEMLQQAMLDFVVKNAPGKNIILIADAKKEAQKEMIVSALPNIKIITPRGGGFLYVNDIASKVESGIENWVILESSNAILLSNVVGLLNGMPSGNNLRLFTLDKNDAYDYQDVSNVHLAKLNFTFPSVNKSYDYNELNSFLISYKNKYGVLPNRYAVRGFDVTYDVILRLASADDVYKATDSDYVTEYIENKFRYTKKLLSGYQNNALYIIKYNSNLQFEEAK